MDVAAYMAELGQQARVASREVARSATAVRNQALLATAEALDAARTADDDGVGDVMLVEQRLDLPRELARARRPPAVDVLAELADLERGDAR